jgi:hypothetical protein
VRGRRVLVHTRGGCRRNGGSSLGVLNFWGNKAEIAVTENINISYRLRVGCVLKTRSSTNFVSGSLAPFDPWEGRVLLQVVRVSCLPCCSCRCGSFIKERVKPKFGGIGMDINGICGHKRDTRPRDSDKMT